MPDGADILKRIETAGRTCYKSEDKITADSAAGFVRGVIKSGHHSVIEHVNISVKFICDRGVSHELVRHRLAAYSQESSRYCNYSKNKFGNEITCIRPVWYHDMPLGEYHEDSQGLIFCNNVFLKCNDLEKITFIKFMLDAEWSYMKLLELGESPQQARCVLPNALKTEIVMTANLREWRHVLNLRCSKPAHPQIRELMLPLLEEFHSRIPVVFDDLYEKYFGTGETEA